MKSASSSGRLVALALLVPPYAPSLGVAMDPSPVACDAGAPMASAPTPPPPRSAASASGTPEGGDAHAALQQRIMQARQRLRTAQVSLMSSLSGTPPPSPLAEPGEPAVAAAATSSPSNAAAAVAAAAGGDAATEVLAAEGGADGDDGSSDSDSGSDSDRDDAGACGIVTPR